MLSRVTGKSGRHSYMDQNTASGQDPFPHSTFPVPFRLKLCPVSFPIRAGMPDLGWSIHQDLHRNWPTAYTDLSKTSAMYHSYPKHIATVSKASSLPHIANTLQEFPPSLQYLAAFHGKQRTLLSLYLSPNEFICSQQSPCSSSEPQIIFPAEVW